MSWETVIGLEIHAQLSTVSKIFSGASTRFGNPPNTQACAVDLGMPGMLPVLNVQAVDMAIRFGLAINAEIAPFSVFARKNYFYPDLPKGYQISQYDRPIIGRGTIAISRQDGGTKAVGITRAHLEEDAGKSLHEEYSDLSGIDLNRAGIPLLEIVSEPDLRSPQEAVAYARKIHSIVRYLEICDGNMQEGSFRIDANISLNRPGTPYGTRAELKNINSFRFLERGLSYEVNRQRAVLEGGGVVIQETRLYDADRDETRSMRGKEEANDYRYFPDPDLLPLVIDQARITAVVKQMPELPGVRKQRFVDQMQLSEYDADVLTASKELADFFEQTLARLQNPSSSAGSAKLCANWIMGDFSAALNRDNISLEESPVSPLQLAQLLLRIADKTISGKIAKQVFESLWQQEGEVDAIIASKGLQQVTDDAFIQQAIAQTLEANPQQLRQYLDGKDKLFGFFVGQVMKNTRGKANPQQLNKLLLQTFSELKTRG